MIPPHLTAEYWLAYSAHPKGAWARWWRRYRNLAAWCAAHPGEGAGGLLEPITAHYTRPRPFGANSTTAGWRIGGGVLEGDITEAEWREIVGLPPRYPLSCVPTWPPLPDRKPAQPTKAERIKRARSYLKRNGLRPEDLVESNGNGQVAPKPNGRPEWRRVAGQWYQLGGVK